MNKKATELMDDPTTHSLWIYGDEMMGTLITHLDSTVFVHLGVLTRQVHGYEIVRKVALDLASSDYYDHETPRSLGELTTIQGRVDLINELVRMRVGGFPGIPDVWVTVMPKANQMLREIRSAREKRADYADTGAELYYHYNVRYKTPHPKDARGELDWGCRLDADGHVSTSSYDRAELLHMLKDGWEVVSVSLARFCKPRTSTLP
jgi:hypothetical protein